jgi:DNA-binding beta-propeller fold protein YncE
MHCFQIEHAPKSRRASFRATAATSGVALSLLVALTGCGSEEKSSPRTLPSAPVDESQWPVIEGPPLRMAASDDAVRAPLDATPSPDGERVYYLALRDNVAGVFSVREAGAEIETLLHGEPLIAPVGISVSVDGEQLFVADSGVTSEGGVGAIMVLPSAGGAASMLEGTAGYVPRGIVVAEVDSEEQVYFTGLDTGEGKHGLFRVGLAGGTVETIASGEPFVDPAGVTITESGDAYVIDALSAGAAAGVVRVRDGEAERVVTDLGVGFPAGIASTRDGSTVLVSGLDPRSRRDRVFVMSTESLEVSVIAGTFDQLVGSAGLHRAHQRDVFAWADTEKDRRGAVYTLEL